MFSSLPLPLLLSAITINYLSLLHTFAAYLLLLRYTLTTYMTLSHTHHLRIEWLLLNGLLLRYIALHGYYYVSLLFTWRSFIAAHIIYYYFI